MDPGTFDRAKLDAFVAAGVTRVSLGAQSFDPEVLKLAGRAHTVTETRRAIEWLGDVRSRVAARRRGEKRRQEFFRERRSKRAPPTIGSGGAWTSSRGYRG